MAKSYNIKGGAKFERALKSLAKKYKHGGTLRVGFLEGTSYPDGTPVAQVAAEQNFGAPAAGIPPRPFFDTMVDKHSSEWPKDLATLLDKGASTERALGLLGIKMQEQLRESIRDANDPPLSPVTLMLRKMKSDNPGLKVTRSVVAEAAARVRAGESYGGVSTKPLIEKGIMITSADFEVEK